MSDNSVASQAKLQFIVRHPLENKIAIIPAGDRWTLPDIIPDLDAGRYYQHYLAGMKMQELWDWRVLTLYQAKAIFHHDFQQNRWIFVLENLDGRDDLPDSARWITTDDIAQIQWDREGLLPVIDKYAQEQATGNAPPQRAAWAKSGWQSDTFEWIREQIEHAGHTITGNIELIRRWCITASYRIPTDRGYLYFKAVPPVFAREVAITQWLADQFPQQLPRILAADTNRRFLLMYDFEAELLNNIDDVVAWERSMRTYAMIQLGTIDRIATLSDLGAMDYRLDTLQTKYDMLLADNEFMQPNFMMTAVDIDAIRATAPAIQQHIATLDALNLPDILLHCDFQALNVAIKDNRVIIFDWTDASIGNPLVDLAAMELFAAEKFSGTPDTVAQLRKAYFSEFEAFASQEVLHQASHSARVISNVLQAVNYHHLLRAIEPEERWVLNMIPKYLLTIVQLLDSD